jgi:hypothetical protein
MKMKRRLFPFMLMFAIMLTIIGILSINQTFSKPMVTNNHSFNIIVDNISSENIDVYYHENTNLSYTIMLDRFIKDYSLSFDVYNDSSFNAILTNTVMQGIPDDLKDILTYTIDINDKLKVNQKYKAIISYKLKDNLTNKELEIVNKYNNIGVNVLLNYNQE